jgi:hypothetical protein
MFKKMIALPLLLLLTIILAQSCDTTEPPDDNVKPGRRDYTWSFDSIGSPGFPYLKSIWGSSPNNVWGAGFSEDVRDCLWHYDGVSWKRAAEGTPITTSGIGTPIVGGVWGTAEDDVWAFGGRRFSNPERSEPFVMHFDGENWSEVEGDKNNMPDGFFDIYGISKDNFWISSYENVYNYRNSTWKKYYIGEKYVVPSIFNFNNNLFITTYPIPQGVDTLFIMKLEGDQFVIEDATNLFNGKFSHSGVFLTSKKIYTFGDRGVKTAKMNSGKIQIDTWEHELITNNINGGFGNSFMISSKDIWAAGGQFPYHYNGIDWQPIDIGNPYNDSWLFGIWGDGK